MPDAYQTTHDDLSPTDLRREVIRSGSAVAKNINNSNISSNIN